MNLGLQRASQYPVAQTGDVAQEFLHQWQPRLGFVSQPGRIGTQRIFGSPGRFCQHLPGCLGAYLYKDYWSTKEAYDSDPRVGGANCVIVGEAIMEPDAHANLHDVKMDHLDGITLGYEIDLKGTASYRFRGFRRRLKASFQWGWDYDPETGISVDVKGTPARGDFDFLPPEKREWTGLFFTLQHA